MHDLPTIIEGPAAAVTFADAKATAIFSDDDDQAYVEMMLKVAQMQIDGPNGWLGRTIGLTKYRMKLPASCVINPARLPWPPFVDITSDSTSDGVRTIEYRAGYGATPESALPEPIKYAIVLMASQLANTVQADSGEIKREIVDGVGTVEYAAIVDASAAMNAAAERLLMPFKVWQL